MIVWHQAHRAAQLVAAVKPGAREDTIGMVLKDMGYRLTQPVPRESLYDLTKLAVHVRLHARAMKEEQT
jgi:cell wall assembly regulator SMI1